MQHRPHAYVLSLALALLSALTASAQGGAPGAPDSTALRVRQRREVVSLVPTRLMNRNFPVASLRYERYLAPQVAIGATLGAPIVLPTFSASNGIVEGVEAGVTLRLLLQRSTLAQAAGFFECGAELTRQDVTFDSYVPQPGQSFRRLTPANTLRRRRSAVFFGYGYEIAESNAPGLVTSVALLFSVERLAVYDDDDALQARAPRPLVGLRPAEGRAQVSLFPRIRASVGYRF